MISLNVQTWVKVVLCLRLAGVGHDTVVGVCPAWGNDEMPLPGDEMPLPETDDNPLLGSGFNFLNAPSAVHKWKAQKIILCEIVRKFTSHVLHLIQLFFLYDINF